jgi:hypothetical protein
MNLCIMLVRAVRVEHLLNDVEILGVFTRFPSSSP